MNIFAKGELKRFNYFISEIGELYHEGSIRFGMSDSTMQILYTVTLDTLFVAVFR